MTDQQFKEIFTVPDTSESGPYLHMVYMCIDPENTIPWMRHPFICSDKVVSANQHMMLCIKHAVCGSSIKADKLTFGNAAKVFRQISTDTLNEVHVIIPVEEFENQIQAAEMVDYFDQEDSFIGYAFNDLDFIRIGGIDFNVKYICMLILFAKMTGSDKVVLTHSKDGVSKCHFKINDHVSVVLMPMLIEDNSYPLIEFN